MTLRSLERGGDGVTMGAYLAVMQVLGVEQDLNLLAKADPLGRELQDARISNSTKVARGGRSQPSGPAPAIALENPPESTDASSDWIADAGFKSAMKLSESIDHSKPKSKKKR